MKVALFIPCMVDQFFPEVGEATAELLERLGVEVDYPAAQTCCGLPFYNMGQFEAAARPARHFLDVFEDYEAIVTPSSSCASMAKHFSARMFGDLAGGTNGNAEADRAAAVGARTHELTSFIVNVLGRTDVGAEFAGSVAIHESCHMRELDARDEPEQLVRGVTGATLKSLPNSDTCCGFGGSFSVKFPEVSGAMNEYKCENIAAARADLIVTTDAGCMLQINGMLHRQGSTARVRHIAELLAGRIELGATT